MKRQRRRCRHCGSYFTICPKVKKHEYCKKVECQKARKRKWQKRKMAESETYRCDQKDAQKIWRENNSDYWKNYRSRNKDYSDNNRNRQKERKRTKKKDSSGRSKCHEFAKMDALMNEMPFISGDYRLIPVSSAGFAKMDALIVKIEVIKGGYGDFPV